MFPKVDFTNANAYKKLALHYNQIRFSHLKDLFEIDNNRFSKFSIQLNEILFDFSKNNIDETTINLLIDLANETGLKEAINSMFHCERINENEHRAVLHTALRNRSNKPVIYEGIDIMPEINAVLNQMKIFSEKVINGDWKGYTNKTITDIVNIGIGGSDLGPVMVTEALKKYKIPHLTSHFISNVDGTHFAETVKNLNPETTLFLIASKTFTTQETMLNAHAARNWFLQSAIETSHIPKHFVALSTAKNEVVSFGIAEENMFQFWDWVGGRYSLWSAIGLSICLSIGFKRFENMLEGAHAIDLHFQQTDFRNNMPVMMAILGIWYINFWGYSSQAIIPYDQYLHRFAAYLQQSDMESNGKHIDRNGMQVDYNTGPLIWGEPGTNGQHAFYQLLHQGTRIIPIDFIAPIHSLNPIGEHHNVLMSNFFAQSEAFMCGKSYENVVEELTSKGLTQNEIIAQAPYRVFEGNRPTNSFLIDEINPYSLGSLIALYEHKIFVQGVIWNIFSFDQWGVELGKKLAIKVLEDLNANTTISSHDDSTNGLINYYKLKLANKDLR